MGPFVDRRNVFMHGAEFDTTYEALMSQLMRNISIALEGCRTELIIQPATSRDACCINVFPTAPFKISPDVVKILGKRLHLVSDPCIIKVSGVEIALTSSEVAIFKFNIFNILLFSSSYLRITRLSSHLLSQRSLYPLSPTSVPSSLEALHRLCRLRSAPHMIIAPSIMAGFIKTINGCVVANPGPLSRGGSGSFLHCDISMSVLQDAELFSECGSFQVVKI
uniref:DNA polymerase alpha subunit B n=1 Tax=Heterorhabditis bacteriophora TaxID=37862 RepID=A0A1I7X8W8_HETBA